MQRNMREPPDTTTQARRSLPLWRSVGKCQRDIILSHTYISVQLVVLSLTNLVHLAGDGNDKGTAGVDGTHGECVQSRHPSHNLFSPAGLFSSHAA